MKDNTFLSYCEDFMIPTIVLGSKPATISPVIIAAIPAISASIANR